MKIRILFLLLATGIAYGQHNHVKQDSAYIDIYSNIVYKRKHHRIKARQKVYLRKLKSKKLTKEDVARISKLTDSLPSYLMISDNINLKNRIITRLNEDPDLLELFAKPLTSSKNDILLRQTVNGKCYKTKLTDFIPEKSDIILFSYPIYSKDNKYMAFRERHTTMGHSVTQINVYHLDSDGFWCPFKSIDNFY